MLRPKQVDVSMLFPEPAVAGGQPTNAMFLSGERKQAIRTSTLIPPREKVARFNKEIPRVQLQNILYVTYYLSDVMKLTPLRTKHFIELTRDLDDTAVSLLIENGLGIKFPTVCEDWKVQDAKNKEVTRKSVSEGKQLVDQQLRDDQPLLEDMLTGEIIERILDTSPYVVPHELCLLKRFQFSHSLLDPEEIFPKTRDMDVENSTSGRNIPLFFF